MNLTNTRNLEAEMLERRAAIGDDNVLALAEFDHVVLFANVLEETVEWVPPWTVDALPIENLIDVRLFGSAGEWHLWRAADRSFGDRPRDDSHTDSFDEPQALWGTRAQPVPGHSGWVNLVEKRGVSYNVPIAMSSALQKDAQVLCLRVRHYVKYDQDTGLAHVFDSRIVGLEEEATHD